MGKFGNEKQAREAATLSLGLPWELLRNGWVQIQILDPPMLTALSKELDCVRERSQPYHVVHFDGHGIYDRQVGPGGLCFEELQKAIRPSPQTPPPQGGGAFLPSPSQGEGLGGEG